MGLVINNSAQFCTVKPGADSSCLWYWGVTKVSFGAEYNPSFSPMKIRLQEHKMKIFMLLVIKFRAYSRFINLPSLFGKDDIIGTL